MRTIGTFLCITSFLLAGCPDSHMLMSTPDSGMPTVSDTGIMPSTPDSGRYEWPDAGAMPTGHAEVIVDRRFGPLSTTIDSTSFPVTTGLMDLYALNDGDRDGTLDRITLETRVVHIDASGVERPSSIHSVVDSCALYRAPDGYFMRHNGSFDGERLVFEDLNTRVTTEDRGLSFPDDFAHLVLLCDVNPSESELGAGETLRVWFSMDWETGATLVEGPPSTVQGTLVLDQNTDPRVISSSLYTDIVRR